MRARWLAVAAPRRRRWWRDSDAAGAAPSDVSAGGRPLVRAVIAVILLLLAVNVLFEVVLLARAAAAPVALVLRHQHVAVDGGFHGDGGAAVGADGRIYVAERDQARVRVFDAAGKLLATWDGSDGTVPLQQPTDVAVLPNGELAVLDAGRPAIVRCRPDGKRWLVIPISGVDTPRSLALLSHGGFAVADTGHTQVVLLDDAGRITMKWGQYGQQMGDFRGPWSVAVGADGTIYVADRGNGRLEAFGSDGRFRREWDTDGPVGDLAMQNGVLYAALPAGDGLEALRPAGGDVLRLDLRPRLPVVVPAPAGLAVAPDGRLVVADAAGLDLYRVKVP